MSESEKYRELANCIRILSAEAIEKSGSGHPGMPLGMADAFTMLAFKFLKFDPQNPRHPNRDRLVLSAGHGSMLLYSFYYLAGFIDFDIEDIKNFRQLDSKTAGHPEYGNYPAIETTTGPLGQGFGNAVGMAIAAKKNGLEHKIYCIAGDGCLMEGISYEAASIAGHLKLDNLIIIFDDNNITIDGNTDLTISEKQADKFTSMGWNAIAIDGHDFSQIEQAFGKSQNQNKPTIILCKTTIGYGCNDKANKASSHGSPLGKEEMKALRYNLNWSEQEFNIPKNLLDMWRNISGLEAVSTEVINATNRRLDISNLFSDNDHPAEATRSSSGKILSKIMNQNDDIICGSADLSGSNNVRTDSAKTISATNYQGNFIHYGTREAAMGAIMNGLALENFIPVGGTFLVFSDYMKPSIRLAALMNLKVIYVFTHDSIGVGEDGPTHQPIEHLVSLRAIPNLLVMRPADFAETSACWQVALENNGPSALILTRQKLPQLANSSDNCKKGAYTLCNTDNYDLTIYATGSEVATALECAKILEQNNLVARIISVTSFELFFAQEASYIDSILSNNKPKFAIEAACSMGWHKFIGDNGAFFGLDHFGKSAPSNDLFNHFGLTADIISQKILDKIN